MKLKNSYTTYLFGEDEAVLVSAEGGEFEGFLRGNEAAAFIIEQLKHDVTQEEIVNRMSERFDAPVWVFERDVAAVVSKLAAVGALEGTGGVSGGPGGAFDANRAPAPVDAAQGEESGAWSFEDVLRVHGSFVYRNVGVSMRPLIKQGRDLVVIGAKPQGRCRKYDVVLYKRAGRYILHRIVQVRSDGYVICGDNCVNREYDITDDDIIGVMTAVVRNGREVLATDSAYRGYAHLWCAAYPVRVLLKKARARAGKVVRKLRGA